MEHIIINEYKCFKDFELKNLSKVNIISGRNNVGKTALLEVLFIDNLSDDWWRSISEPFAYIAKNRDIEKTKIEKYLKNTNFSAYNYSKNKNFTIKYKNRYEIKNKDLVAKYDNDKDFLYYTLYDKDESLESLSNIEAPSDVKNFINSSRPTNKMLVQLYSGIQTRGVQHKFLEYLKILDSNIAWIEPQLFDDELLLRINLINPEHSLISSELGEGVNRYIEILATLLINSKGSVFIDEIENGLHYSKLKYIAKAIIEIAQKEDIQIFITTHDKETIEAFVQASEELQFQDIRSIELYKDETNTIKSIVRDAKQFIATIDTGIEVR